MIFGSIFAKTQFDNSIIGVPKILCEKDRIRVEVQTQKPFNGKIFVKGEYANRNCVRNYELGRRMSNEEVIERERALSFYSNTLPSEFSKFKSNAERMESLTNPDYVKYEIDSHKSSIHKEQDGISIDTYKNINSNEIPQNHDHFSEPHMGTITKAELKDHDVEAASISEHPGPKLKDLKTEKYKDSELKSDKSIKSGKTKKNDTWTGHGGATTGKQAAFGGATNEERTKPAIVDLQILDRYGLKAKKAMLNTTSSTISNTAQYLSKLPDGSCPIQKCEPCDCDKRKRRETEDANNIIDLEVPLGSCNAKRDRSLSPPSLVISFVAIVSFHDSFITKLDRAYHVQCAYTEADKKLTTQLDHGAIYRYSWVCRVTHLPLRYYRNGWTPDYDMYYMLVHDCYVEDGNGERFQVIDAKGCSLDKYTLATPTYADSRMSASVEAFTFKFPDRTNVDFRCSITFCQKDEERCQRRIPPRCDESTREKRSIDNDFDEENSVLSNETMTLHANSLTVLDVDTDLDSNEFHPLPQPLALQMQRSLTEAPPTFCVSIVSFGLIVSASTFLTTISAAIAFVYLFLQRKDVIYG
ncbi:hypothetical protein WR25_04006 [Diploscapter pachys]|uniref:ZP domain-containing protein n=1 Tax=Diploscapter pachys TaxID=2018661 RepID=A0A2A2JAS3_9BILA|nr:hypothetical protein WR25_04006 [Diploscapter pachys]